MMNLLGEQLEIEEIENFRDWSSIELDCETIRGYKCESPYNNYLVDALRWHLIQMIDNESGHYAKRRISGNTITQIFSFEL